MKQIIYIMVRYFSGGVERQKMGALPTRKTVPIQIIDT